jgi:hypothetical protein
MEYCRFPSAFDRFHHPWISNFNGWRSEEFASIYRNNQLSYWKDFRPQVLETHRQYVVYSVDKPPVFIHDYSSALAFHTPPSIVECIGCEGYGTDMLVLKLLQYEIPNPQPEEIEYPSEGHEYIPFLPRCFYGVSHRRWCVYPILSNGTYYGVTFFNDTGAPITSLEPKTRMRIFGKSSSDVYSVISVTVSIFSGFGFGFGFVLDLNLDFSVSFLFFFRFRFRFWF